MKDRRLIVEVAETTATVSGAIHAARCDTEGCHYVVHAGTADRAREALGEHLRTDARHTGGAWIDRDGRARVGLDYADGAPLPRRA